MLWWLANIRWAPKASSGIARATNWKVSQYSCTWLELAMIFKMQTGYDLGGKDASVADQADALRKMLRAAWSKAVHRINGKIVTPKQYWRPGVYIASIDMITGIKTAGILRRPVLDRQLWKAVVQHLERAKAQGDAYLRASYKVPRQRQWIKSRDDTVLELLKKMPNAQDEGDAEANRQRILQSHIEKQREKCWFGHTVTTGRANGRSV